MKNLIILACTLMSVSAFAVPRGLYLASPKTIVVDRSNVKLYFELKCKNEYPDEWAGNLVAVSDDEGDMSIALGVVLARSSCDPGPAKEFVFTYALREAKVTLDDIKHDVQLVPIDIEN